MLMDAATLLDGAKAVLDTNNQGSYTIPAGGLYPHQWLWDSCFIAIGLSNFDADRAKIELLSLLRGQWSNGMLAHMIFADGDEHRRDRNIWRSWVSFFAPDDVATSGITQPPMLAEAIVRVGKQLPISERRSWYRTMYPALLKHHQWLYADRDPHKEGLVLQIHPYETGLDNTPPWISEMRKHSQPWWAIGLKKSHLDVLVNLFRRDTKHVPPGQRMSNIEALIYYDAIRRLRRKFYSTEEILPHALFAIEDLTFNCIFIRGNHHLREIAKTLKQDVPTDLRQRMQQTEQALEDLWDPYSNQYYSRNFVTHHLIKEPSIATLMPLYAGTISKDRAAKLVKMLEDKHVFGSPYPVPSVPINSAWFDPVAYWQGPTWLNTNWLIIAGLRQYGFNEQAVALTESTLEMVTQAGFYEYFNPLDGAPAGAKDFSWTAALILDLLSSSTETKQH